MKLLVTGGAGFIGSNFILYWTKKFPDDSILNLDNLTYAGNVENLTSIKDNKNYTFVHGDICDATVVSQVIRGVDTVVHFAAETHVDRSIENPVPFVKTNVVGTQVLLDAAKTAGVKRFHHISTDEVFGSLTLADSKKFNEQTPYDPRSPYSATKAAGDHLVRAYYHTYGLPITITNCSNNFGPFQYPEKLIPLAITNIIEGKKVPVYGDGKNIRDWLHVADHCRALEVVIKNGTVGETYCIGGMTQDMDNLTVVRLILQKMGKDESSIEFVKDRLGHDRRYAMDWSKMKNQFGWQPEHNFEDWLSGTIEWYKSHDTWWRRLKK